MSHPFKKQGLDQPESSGVIKPMEQSAKIALIPFAPGEPPVHLLDAAGKASSARHRSAEDDFQLAVQGLGVGTADEGEGAPTEDTGGEEEQQPRDAGTSAAEQKVGVEGDGSGESGATREAASPPEHPLQKAVTSFDMALGELNQLVHLVDLARAGEFMVLERVTPSEEAQARAMSDQSARPGDGVPREALPTMVNLKRSQLKGAAAQLRKRAERLRETSEVQRVFQQGVVHLRKSWRIVAPNHGKVNVPLQVGEALCVDCSFGSAGGKTVPFTAAAGSRHRHPWLFQLKCGEGGQLKAQPSSTQGLKAFEVQLVSVETGVCQHSLRASFSAGNDRGIRADSASEAQRREPSPTSNGGTVHEEVGPGDMSRQMNQLEKQISRLQHGVFWEEVFETLKAEALIDGKDGWPAHQNATGADDVGGNGKVAVGNEAVGRIEEGAKRRLVNLSPQGVAAASAQNAGARVVHVLDNEVMVEMGNDFLLGYKLVSGESVSGSAASSVCAGGNSSGGKSEGWKRKQSESLCRLALLYCGSLVRQQQRTQVAAARSSSSKSVAGRKVGAWIPAGSSGGKAGHAKNGGQFAAPSTWKAVRRVLVHHVFRSEVVQGLAHVSTSLRKIGLPFAVRWTHLEETCPASALSFTLGHCFHFRVSLGDRFGVIVSALPGLQNHADQRSVELQSAHDLESFLLGEICRQIVLTFGDITAAWTSGVQPEGTACFRVDLVPAAIHLLQSSKCKSTSEDADGGSCEVRVFVQEVGIQIACSSGTTSHKANGRGPSTKEQADGSEATAAAWPSEPPASATPEVDVAEWDKLEGQDLFGKFSSLLAIRYPL